MAVDSNPSCYGWYDERDPSCRKCSVMEACKGHQDATRPACFAELYDASHPECIKCLDNSRCAEEFNKMAAPKIRIKRPAAAAAVAEPEPEEEEVVATEEATVEEPEVEETVVEEDAEEDASPYEEMGTNELRAELESRGLDNTGRRSVMIERLEADDAKPVAKKAAAPVKTVAVPPVKAKTAPATATQAVAPKVAVPATKTAAPAVAAKPAAVAPKAEPKLIPQKAKVDNGDATELGNTTIRDYLQMLRDGESLILTRDGDALVMSMGGKVSAAPAAAASGGKKLRGDAFWKEVLSPEYWAWYYEDAGAGKPWGDMNADEKQELCDDLGVEFEHADDPRINAVHMVSALLGKLNIKKYKPEYEKAAARDAIKA